MWFMSFDLRYRVLFIIISISTKLLTCRAVSNTNFNENIRDFSLNEDHANIITNAKTLQKEEFVRYANFAPVHNPIKFKEIPDNTISSSNYGRGFLHHDYTGYDLKNYDESPHLGYGYEYQLHDSEHPTIHHDSHEYPHHYDHHDSGHYHSGHHHVGYGHHKHFNHALTAKAVLWPIAGIALLGAAAALVTNPILLQLGVVSGKRRRRDTEVSVPDFDPDIVRKLPQNISKQNEDSDKSDKLADEENSKGNIFKTITFKNMNRNGILRKSRSNIKSDFGNKVKIQKHKINDDDRFIPIPLLVKHAN